MNDKERNKPAAIVADKEHRVSDIGPDEGAESEKERPGGWVQPAAPAEPRRGFFDIYKLGQGYYTRIYSGVAFGALVCWLAYFIWGKLAIVEVNPTTRIVRVAIPIVILLVFGLLGYWLLALNRSVCDFLIATEGEVKKVNWTTRKDIIGSTKVVIFVVIALSLLLTVVDVFFTQFFRTIGVLK